MSIADNLRTFLTAGNSLLLIRVGDHPGSKHYCPLSPLGVQQARALRAHISKAWGEPAFVASSSATCARGMIENMGWPTATELTELFPHEVPGPEEVRMILKKVLQTLEPHLNGQGSVVIVTHLAVIRELANGLLQIANNSNESYPHILQATIERAELFRLHADHDHPEAKLLARHNMGVPGFDG